MEVSNTGLLLDVIAERERRESGFSDVSLPETPIGDFRRDSCDSGLSGSATNFPTFNLSEEETGSLRPIPEKPRRRRRKKRLCESLTVAKFQDVYKLTGEELGEGSYGKVQTCVKIYTKQEYAVKIVSKSSWHFSRPKILKEIELYHLCQGRREIIQMIEYFEEDDAFYLIFEKAEGGPLLDQIQRRVHFTEKEASTIIRDLAAALTFLHGKGIAHRDLKPENVLCTGNGKDFLPVKLCDFDLCSAVYQTITTPKLQSPVGSVEYMAPEVVEAFTYDLDFVMDKDFEEYEETEDLELTYDKRCDLWSLGVVGYILLCGYLPFTGSCGEDCGWDDRGEECAECQSSLFNSIKHGNLVFPEEHWSSVSSEAKDLIKKLLVRDASMRIDAAHILEHPWIVSEGQMLEGKDEASAALETPGVLRTRHKSVHDISMRFSNALAARMAAADPVMKKSATVLDLNLVNTVPIDIVKLGTNKFLSTSIAKNMRMRRQTSLIWLPENGDGKRWEF